MMFILFIIFILLLSILIVLIMLLNNKKNVNISDKKNGPPVVNSVKEEEIEVLCVPEKSEVIEILDLDEQVRKDKKLERDILDETIDLNELFKTMSINVIKQDDVFDFGLLRKRKRKI